MVPLSRDTPGPALLADIPDELGAPPATPASAFVGVSTETPLPATLPTAADASPLPPTAATEPPVGTAFPSLASVEGLSAMSWASGETAAPSGRATTLVAMAPAAAVLTSEPTVSVAEPPALVAGTWVGTVAAGYPYFGGMVWA